MPLGSVNYADQYQNQLSQAFPYVLYFQELFTTPNNGRYRWINSHTIEIPTIHTGGRVDGDRDNIGTRKRNYDTAWTPLAVTNHRTFQTFVHPRDIDETNGLASIGNITRVFNEEQKFPEMNAYCISKLFNETQRNGGVIDTTALNVSNVLTIFDNLMKGMDNKRVPRQGRVLYVDPTTGNLIKNAQAIQRNYAVQSGGSNVSRIVTSIDQVKIVDGIPEDMMKTVYDFTDGWEVDNDARQINMVLVHPMGVITPIHYEFAQLDPPSAGSQGKYEYFEESFEDVFILPNRQACIAFSVASQTGTFTAVVSPTGNPKSLGYYEKQGSEYFLTEDTSAVSGKTYYSKS